MSEDVRDDEFSLVEEGVAAELRSRDLFSDFDGILTERNEEITYEVDKAAQKFHGLVISVVIDQAGSSNPEVPGPDLDDCKLIVTIEEYPSINNPANEGTGIRAKRAVREVLAALQLFTPPGTNSILTVDKPAFKNIESKGLAYQVNFRTAISLPDSSTQ